MNPKGKPWTYEEEQELLDLRYAGISIIEVAEILNRTVDSCRKKHWKLLHQEQNQAWYERIAEHESGELEEGNDYAEGSNK